MKIAATTLEGGLDDIIVQQFGRAPSFTIVEFDGKEARSIEVIKNPAVNQARGAGIAASQLLVDRGVKVVLTGNVGPKAMDVLKSAGIKIYRAGGMKVEDALLKFANGELEEITTAIFGWGPGKGSGGGTGRGMGRGIGRGTGKGAGGKGWM
mgnify:CR=1 FL=1